MLRRSSSSPYGRKVVLGISLLMATLAVALALRRIVAVSHATTAAVNAPNPSLPQPWARCAAGPWGDLEWVHISIERPDEFISLSQPVISQSRWLFEGYSPEQLAGLFRASGLTGQQRELLLDRNRWEAGSNGVYVTPDRALILGLSPEARQRIYNVLAESPENYYQHLAFKYRNDGFAEWFDRSGLSPDVLTLVKRLLYRRGTALCFSDMVEAMSQIPSAEEQKRLVKTLSRVSTVLVRLNVGPGADVDALVRYWGKEGHAKDIKPLLQSLVNVPGGASIDVAHLLPPFARMRLYTYPFPSEDPLASKRDCFWTSMNFFDESPDDRFCDFAYTKEVIHSQYYPIQDDPTYGDVLWLIDGKERVIHAAVYVAADIVFTKNGAHFGQPWILMHFKDMLAMFTSEKPLRMVAYRLKNE